MVTKNKATRRNGVAAQAKKAATTASDKAEKLVSNSSEALSKEGDMATGLRAAGGAAAGAAAGALLGPLGAAAGAVIGGALATKTREGDSKNAKSAATAKGKRSHANGAAAKRASSKSAGKKKSSRRSK